MGLRFTFLFIFLLSSSAYSAPLNLDNLFEENIFDTRLEDVRRRVNKSDRRVDIRETIMIFDEIEFRGHQAGLATAILLNGKVNRMFINFRAHKHFTKSYEYWSDFNSKKLNELKGKYGNPVDVKYNNDGVLAVTWNVKGMTVVMTCRAIKAAPQGVNYCTIIYEKPGFKYRNYGHSIYLGREFTDVILARLNGECKANLASSTELKSIKAEIIKLSKSTPAKAGVKYLYKPYQEQPFLNFDSYRFLKIYYLDKSLEDAMPADGPFLRFSIKDKKIVRIESIKNDKGKKSVSSYMRLIYGAGGELKVVESKGTQRFYGSELKAKGKLKHSYIDYDKSGRPARALVFDKLQLDESNFIYFDKDYNKKITARYSHFLNEVAYFDIRDYSSFLEYELTTAHHDKPWYTTGSFSTPATLSRGYNHLFKIYQAITSKGLDFYITNYIKDSGFRPKKAFQNDFLKRILEYTSKAYTETSHRNGEFVNKIKELTNKPKIAYEEMAFNGAVFTDVRNDKLPFVINKTAKTAVQLKTDSGKLATLFLNKVALGRYQLIKILEDGGEFKDHKTGNFFKMTLQKPFSQKTGRLYFNGNIHTVQEGSTFFGYVVSFENNLIVLKKDNKSYKPNKVGVYNIKFEKKDLLKPFKESYLSPKDIELAQKANFGIPYYVKFCSIMIRTNTKIPLDDGRARYSQTRGTFWAVDSNQKLISKTAYQDYEGDIGSYSYNRGKFYYKNKPFVLRSVPGFRNKKYSVVLDDKKTLVLDFIPNNSWTFARMIKKFFWLKYDFTDNTVIVNGQEENFKYKLFPDQDIIEIEGQKYEIVFHRGQLLIKGKDMLIGQKVSLWKE